MSVDTCWKESTHGIKELKVQSYFNVYIAYANFSKRMQSAKHYLYAHLASITTRAIDDGLLQTYE